MSNSPWDFVESVLDALDITPPGTGEYDAGECATLALQEIDSLKMRSKMLELLEKAPETRVEKIAKAASLVKTARNHLKSAGCEKAAQFVTRALRSVDGALRHARGLKDRAEMQNAMRGLATKEMTDA